MIALRDFLPEDAHRLVNILNDKKVIQYLSTKLPYPYTMNDANWWINEGSKAGHIKAITWEGLFVGCIGINPGEFEYCRNGEIGYWLDRAFWRKGITSKAIQKITKSVFEQTDITRIFATVFSENKASMKLLLRNGFKQEAVLENAIFKNGQFYNSHILSILKSKQRH